MMRSNLAAIQAAMLITGLLVCCACKPVSATAVAGCKFFIVALQPSVVAFIS